MSGERGVQFTETAADKIVQATNYTLANRSILGAAPRPGTTTAESFTVRCTSSTPDGDGNFPGKVTQFDASANDYADYGACLIRGANGEGLSAGTNYPATPAGNTAAGKALYVAGGGGGSGAKAYANPNNVINFAVPLGLTGSTGAYVILPSAGTYVFTGVALWGVSAFGIGADALFALLTTGGLIGSVGGINLVASKTWTAGEAWQSPICAAWTFAAPARVDLWAWNINPNNSFTFSMQAGQLVALKVN